MQCGNRSRIATLIWLNLGYFFVELVIGIRSHSNTLVADSFHMLSDVAALVIAFLAISVSNKKWEKNTYGFARAEVLGAFANGIFLSALCLSILLDAIKLMVKPEELTEPKAVFIAGVIGLVVNLFGLMLVSGSHGHSHHRVGSHEHRHSRHEERLDATGSTDDSSRDTFRRTADTILRENLVKEYAKNLESEAEPSLHSTNSAGQPESAVDNVALRLTEDISHPETKGKSLNMKGVFLHVMADTLGSVIVCVSSLISWLTDFGEKEYVDPSLSMVIVILVLLSTAPLLKETGFILLQTIPSHIDISKLKEKIMLGVPEVIDVHELHVWQLVEDRIVASVHVTIDCKLGHSDQMKTLEAVKKNFHDLGIHSTTVQLECIDPTDMKAAANAKLFGMSCLVKCPMKVRSIDTCGAKTCCGPHKHPLK